MTPKTPTPVSREQLEQTIAAARAELDAQDLAAAQKAQAELEAKRERSMAVHVARTAAGVEVEAAAVADRDAAKAAFEQAIATSPLTVALAEYLAADLNLQRVRRELDTSFFQSHPDFSAPSFDPVAPKLRSVTEVLAEHASTLADQRLEATERTRRATEADYVEGRTDTFDPLAGVAVLDAPESVPHVDGGMTPTPDPRTPEEIITARGGRVAISSHWNPNDNISREDFYRDVPEYLVPPEPAKPAKANPFLGGRR